MITSALLLVVATSQNDAANKIAVDPVKKVCRREETTGSMLAKRVCHTRAEWDKIDTARSRAAEDAINARAPTRPQ